QCRRDRSGRTRVIENEGHVDLVILDGGDRLLRGQLVGGDRDVRIAGSKNLQGLRYQQAAIVDSTPTERSPLTVSCSFSNAIHASRSSSRIRCACRASTRPLSVSWTCLPTGVRSLRPTCFCRMLSCWETAEGVKWSAAAAPFTLPRRASSCKIRSRCMDKTIK